MKRKHLLLAAAVFTTAVATGCGGTGEVTFKSGGMTHTFAEGEAAALEGFPLPTYPGAQTQGSVSAQGDAEEESRFLMMTSGDEVKTIGRFYTEEMGNAGWSIISTHEFPSMVNIIARKNGLEGNVMISGDGDRSSISLSVSTEIRDTPKVSSAPVEIDPLNPPTD